MRIADQARPSSSKVHCHSKSASCCCSCRLLACLLAHLLASLLIVSLSSLGTSQTQNPPATFSCLLQLQACEVITSYRTSCCLPNTFIHLHVEAYFRSPFVLTCLSGRVLFIPTYQKPLQLRLPESRSLKRTHRPSSSLPKALLHTCV